MDNERAILDLFQVRFKITFKSKPLAEHQNTQGEHAMVACVARILGEGQGGSTAKLMLIKDLRILIARSSYHFINIHSHSSYMYYINSLP